MSSMSLFRKPFSPKKAPPRKATTISPLQMDAAERSREFSLDYIKAHFYIGNYYFNFEPESGYWNKDMAEDNYIPKKQNYSMTKDAQKIMKENIQLQEENNLLKVKNEILVDMVAEICSEYGLETKKKQAN